LISVPSGSTASLSDETLVNPNFIVDLPGIYVVQLIVNNAIQDSVPSTVTVTNTNRTPLADAGENSIIALSQAVQLDGGNSFDIDGNPITYLWSMTEKPVTSSATFDDDTIQTPQFTPDVKGNYIIDLVVNDGIEDSNSDQVEVLAGLTLDLEVADGFFGVGRETTATLVLDLPAPPQGVDISLDVDETVLGLTTTTISFEEGQTEKSFVVTGLSIGTTDLSASGTNIAEVSVIIEVSGALISIDSIAPLSPSASTSVAISLSDMAPLGGVTIDLETLDPAVATVAPTSLFIAEGQFTPAQNAQVTGVGLGSTLLRATGNGFAPDEKAIDVALSAEFDPTTLNVPETLTRDIVLTLDAPAPQGGVNFDLSVVGSSLFGVQNTIAVAEGETQSQPITLTGLEEGQAILRASANGFIDADATITVIDAPNVFLSASGSSSHLPEAIVGIDLQDAFRFRLEVTPTSAVDIRVSVPQNSGVLLSTSSTVVGSEILLLEDLVGTTSNFILIQGTNLGDDVPITLEVFEANTENPAGYEALASTVDIDPSGVFLSSSDFSTTTFTTNRSVAGQVALLYDSENVDRDGTLRKSLRVRAGTTINAPMQVDDDSILTLPDGATGTLSFPANSLSATVAITPAASGVANVSIANQPPGFSLPSDRNDNVEITITTPEAFVRSAGSSSHLAEAIVGLDLQRLLYVGLETAPLSPVDILVEVPVGSGTSLSTLSTGAGSTQILFEDVNSTRSPAYYLQGISLGDNVPITVTVFSANTTDPAGYTSLVSTADVDPSGIFVATGDYNTTSFSSNRSVNVQSVLLFDDETPSRDGERLSSQAIRGGLDLVVPMQIDNIAVANLPAGATDDLTIAAGSTSNNISVDPVGAGQATVSIASLPGAFAIPTNLDDNTVVTVSAANAFLRSTGSASHQVEATVGIDLQTPQYIGLAVTPPTAVDINVSVPVASGVLLSGDGSLSGTNSLLFEDVTSTRSPLFYAQGIALGDDVAVTIEVFEANTNTPIGYNVLSSTIDVDPSGVYMATSDIATNTFAPNRPITAVSALLFDDENVRDGQFRAPQAVRGGIDLSLAMSIDDDTVAVLPSGSTDTLTISSNQSNGSIEVDPLTAGIATVSITAQPNASFTLPSDRDADVVITITAPDARFNTTNVSVGDELQVPISVTLAATPPNPVDVTVEISSAAVGLISTDNTLEGSASVVFNNITSTSVGTIYVQGLSLNGATQIKVSAPGYNDGTADISVVSSGFRINSNFSNITVGNTRAITISGARLNPNGTFSGSQQVRGGASFDIVTTSSLPSIGSVTSPVTLSGGASSGTSTFTAIAPGTTTIEITQPTGFTPPVGLADGDITVE
jgi:hypothetical protein